MIVAVFEAGTLKAASERLYKTQPAVSQGIAKLEATLGLKLFDRQSYRLTPTLEGERLLQHAKKVLAESDRMLELAGHYSAGFETEVTLAFEASYDLNRLLPALETTQNNFPDTQITLKQHYVSGAFQAVIDETADIAFTPVFDSIRVSNKFHRLPMYSGSLITVAAPKLLARYPNLSKAEELQNEYQIIIQDTGISTKGIDLGVQDGQRRWYVNDFSTKKMLIQSGMGWGSLPDFLVTNELRSGILEEVDVPNVPTQRGSVQYYALKRAAKILGPVGQFLWQALEPMSQEKTRAQ